MKSLRLLLALAFAGMLSTAIVRAGDKAECADKDAKKCCCEKDKDGKACGKDKPCCCAAEAPKGEEKKAEKAAEPKA